MSALFTAAVVAGTLPTGDALVAPGRPQTMSATTTAAISNTTPSSIQRRLPALMAWSGSGDVPIAEPTGLLTGTSRWISPASTVRAARTAGGAIGDAGADNGCTALMGTTSIGCPQWGHVTRTAVACPSVGACVPGELDAIVLLVFWGNKENLKRRATLWVLFGSLGWFIGYRLSVYRLWHAVLSDRGSG